MKHTIATALLLLAATLTIAQPPDDPTEHMGEAAREKINALRVAFFTQTLDLSPDESKDFWPLYEEWKERERGIHKAFMKKHPRREISNLDDRAAAALIADDLQKDEDLLQLKRDYLARMQRVLPTAKVAQIRVAEAKFRRQLLERLRDRRGGDGNGRRGMRRGRRGN